MHEYIADDGDGLAPNGESKNARPTQNHTLSLYAWSCRALCASRKRAMRAMIQYVPLERLQADVSYDIYTFFEDLVPQFGWPPMDTP